MRTLSIHPMPKTYTYRNHLTGTHIHIYNGLNGEQCSWPHYLFKGPHYGNPFLYTLMPKTYTVYIQDPPTGT